LTYFWIINYFSHHKSSTYHEKKTFRNLHRDLGYFYGLIISFAFRTNDEPPDMWHPEKYTTKTRATQVQLPEESEITDDFAKDLGKKLGIDDKMRRQTVKRNV
jgi:hypothetical protein